MSECVIGYETVDGSFVGVTCAGEGYILDEDTDYDEIEGLEAGDEG